MINLRYHIVSITAVFLALAIGIAVGSAFIDKATVETLRARLDDLETRVENTDAENSDLRDQLGTLGDQQRELADQGTGELFRGHLQDVPVVIVAARGVDRDSFEGARDSIVNAGARFAGTLWATDRLRLEDPNDVNDLAQVLGLPSGDAERLRRSVTFRLGSLFRNTMTPVELPHAEPGTTDPPSTSSTLPGETTTTLLPEEPPLLQALRADGFLDYDPPSSSPIDGAILPKAGARYVVLGGPGAEVDGEQFLYPLLRSMTATGPAPVVAAQASTGDSTDESRTVFVGPIRSDETLSARVSTVDDLESFAGWAGVVLALEDARDGTVGHFGVGEGADRLLPAPPAAS